jgi:hypothetical protein
MKRTFIGTCAAAALGLALSANAQTTPQTPPARPQTPDPGVSASATMDKDTKLTGCLKAGSETGTYELTNVKKGAGAASATSPSSPSSAPSSSTPSASASASDAPKNVKLSAAPGTDLASHVGHTIEVTGSWKGGASATATSPSADTSASASAKGGKEFQVSKVSMVSSTCTAGTN